MQDIVNKLYHNPRKIFNLPEQPDTYIEVNMDQEWIIPQKMKFSKAQWTPFAGMKVKGAVTRVVMRGQVVYVDRQVKVLLDIIDRLWSCVPTTEPELLGFHA